MGAPPIPPPGAGADDATAQADRDLVARLKAGDRAAFEQLVDAWMPSMLRVARAHVASQAAAEEVVQDTWLGVLRGLDRFEGRSSLKTWVFRILVNQAKTRGVRDHRSVPFSALAGDDPDADAPVVDPTRFVAEGERYAGHWAAPLPRWDELPAERLESRETLAAIGQAIDALPPRQRTVITLRDVEGWDAAEVSEALDLTEGNQRVLLHRARAKVREALEQELAP